MGKSRESSAPGARAVKNRRSTKSSKIDFSDIPELSDAQLALMKRVGRPPIGDRPKKLISIRLDEGVLDWVKRAAAKQDQPYQTLIGEILARAMRKGS